MAEQAKMRLSNSDIVELTQWRRELHRYPELSGEEEKTSERVCAMLKATGPSKIIRGLGGHGVAAIYDSGNLGPRVLLRCELDGLPIDDLSDVPHRSTVAGKGHQCGHDGHMAMLAAMARLLGRNRPPAGAVILMFQPAEEDGSGARMVVDDPAFAALAPDYSFAIHNMPGRPFGEVDIVDGPVCCASRGMKITLTGRTAHASQPETGISPMNAIATLMIAITEMSSKIGTPTRDPGYTLVTVTHTNMGVPAYGVAPGEAQIFATLRTLTDDKMAGLVDRVENQVSRIAEIEQLKVSIEYSDVFVTCENNTDAANIVRAALDGIKIPHGGGLLPMRGSEDFGHFGAKSRAALLLLGSGESLPALHNPDYDFPDDLIPIGAAIFSSIIDEVMCRS